MELRLFGTDGRPMTPDQVQAHEKRMLEQEQIEKPWRVSLYRAFLKSSLHPKCAAVYYPGCGNDDALVDAFPDSKIFLVDKKPLVINALKTRGYGSNVQVIQASALDFTPDDPVDVLIVHAMDKGVDLSHAIATVVDGGFVLVMHDNLERFQRPDLTLVGTLNTADHDPAKISEAQYDTQARARLLLSGSVFEPGGEERVASVQTNDEFMAVAPRLFGQFERELALVALDPHCTKTVVQYASGFIDLPMKDPSVVVCIYQKKSVVEQ